jgi:nicotinate-nucleotide adenylyltransferase
MEKIGLFGGSFDPIHTGHLILAQTALEFAGLDRIFFIPTAIPPHKQDRALSHFKIRCEMVRLAIEDNDAFEISMMEEGDHASYTFETVPHYCALGYDREHLHLLVGGDSLSEIGEWKNPEVIFDNATIVAMRRPGFEDIAPAEGVAMIIMETGYNSISSSGIRELVGEGRSIRYLVPVRVERFIEENGLYLG